VGEQYKRNPNTVCIICKKAIYKRPSVISSNKGRVFCSSFCYSVSCRKEIPCVVCGKPILAGLNKRTCSRACANINRTGIKYHLGRPRDKVVSQQALKVRLSLERGKVCERCGFNKYGILQVHHKNRNNKENELSNLELICPNCHYEDHYLFGKKLIEIK
jgi:predicted nucleic acid-binding Zn ribbon protein